ncbi:MAG: multidrug effflux MFS transporter [Hyphomicrobiales bacterium]
MDDTRLIEAKPHAETKPRVPFVILILISAIGPLALNIFVPSMPGLQKAFAIPYSHAQLTLTLYLIGMAVCQLFYGPLSDRYGRRPMVMTGLVLFTAASALAAVSTGIEMLIVARLLQALGGAAGLVLSRAMVRDVYDRDKSASVIAYITMAYVLAPMVAPMIGGFLDEIAGWRASFLFLTLVGLAVSFAAWRTLPETTQAVSRHAPLLSLEGFVRLLRKRRFVAYVLTIASASSVFFAFLGGAPHVMIDVLGYSPKHYGMWFALISIGYMSGNFLSGRYSMKFGIDRLVLAGNLLTLCGALIGLAIALSGYLSPAGLFLPMALCAAGNGLTIPNGTAGAISVDHTLIGAAAGLAGFLQTGCGAVASQLVGTWQDSEPHAVFWMMAIASIAAVVAHAINLSGHKLREIH